MFREEIEALEQNGITRTVFRRLDDPKVIPLWFGEGDMATPEVITNAAKDALDQGFTFYGHTRGRAELRTAIRAYCNRLYGTDVSFERITVPGSSMLGITLATQMTLGQHDHAILITPHWPNIDRAIAVIGAEFSHVRQRCGARGWHLDLDEVSTAIKPNTRAIYINSPCNPTGWVMQREQQQELLRICRERGVVIIADEVYHRTIYDAEVAPSFLEIATENDPVIVVNGFSKAFAMTGWRLGWMITPSGFGEQMAVLSECFNTGAPSFIQRAGIAALEQGDTAVQQFRAQYQAGRSAVMAILGKHPLVELTEPEGAFYAFVRIPGLKSSDAFVNSVLDEQDVGLAPGFTFGPGNDEYFRLCYAQSNARLREALGRIVVYLDQHADDYR
jgi:aspartate aminotransferase